MDSKFQRITMESQFIPTEQDFQDWIGRAVKSAFEEFLPVLAPEKGLQEPFLNREEMISILKISMATLRNWQKSGLPYHKVQNKVFFLHSEVYAHIKAHKIEANNAQSEPIDKTE